LALVVPPNKSGIEVTEKVDEDFEAFFFELITSSSLAISFSFFNYVLIISFYKKE
jgi:hypothetical protein